MLQASDLVRAEAELGKYLFGLLTELGGRATILLGVRDSATGWPTRRM